MVAVCCCTAQLIHLKIRQQWKVRKLDYSSTFFPWIFHEISQLNHIKSPLNPEKPWHISHKNHHEITIKLPDTGSIFSQGFIWNHRHLAICHRGHRPARWRWPWGPGFHNPAAFANGAGLVLDWCWIGAGLVLDFAIQERQNKMGCDGILMRF